MKKSIFVIEDVRELLPMYRNLFSLLTLGVLLTACSRTAPHIVVVCEENNVGNCIVRWEMYPFAKGKVKVYASTNPDAIPEEPIAMADVTDQKLTIITTDPVRRYYYTLVFDGKYRVKVATRNVNIPGIQNFRDLGGYPSYSTGKVVRWGMVYRSAEIESLEDSSIGELKNLGIKTIIDLRSLIEVNSQTDLQKNFDVVHLPIGIGEIEKLQKEVNEQKIKSDTVCRIAERMDRDLMSKLDKEYRQIFDILLDKGSYPVVIHCSSDKGSTGIVSALLLAALGVDEETIMEDYRFNNDYFNNPPTLEYAYRLPMRSREVFAPREYSDDGFLTAVKKEVERRYGDVDTYLQQGIGLTKDEIKRLRSMLLADGGR
ncbi:protein-tyrosine phosphatase [Bacteroides zoogleoformans]|nr:protein-tyrosine phosphatase [Bacteroides zoogleoformans]